MQPFELVLVWWHSPVSNMQCIFIQIMTTTKIINYLHIQNIYVNLKHARYLENQKRTSLKMRIYIPNYGDVLLTYQSIALCLSYAESLYTENKMPNKRPIGRNAHLSNMQELLNEKLLQKRCNVLSFPVQD